MSMLRFYLILFDLRIKFQLVAFLPYMFSNENTSFRTVCNCLSRFVCFKNNYNIEWIGGGTNYCAKCTLCYFAARKKAVLAITMSIGFYFYGRKRCNMRIYACTLDRTPSSEYWTNWWIKFFLAHFCISESACPNLCAVCQITNLIFKITVAFTFIGIIVFRCASERVIILLVDWFLSTNSNQMAKNRFREDWSKKLFTFK